MPDGILPWILVGVLALVVGWLMLNRKPAAARPASPEPKPQPATRAPEPEPEEPDDAEHEDAFFYALGCGIGFYRSARYMDRVLAKAAETLLPGGHNPNLLHFGREVWEQWFGGEIVPERLCQERILPAAKDWPDERKDALMTGSWVVLLIDDPEAGKGYVDPDAHDRQRRQMTSILESLGAGLYGPDHETRMASVRARAEALARDIFPQVGL